MLKLHDLMKADHAYQSSAAAESFEFPAGSSWMVYTDMVGHAVLSGRYALEQTYIVSKDAMVTPEKAPVRILEKMVGAALTA